MSQDQKEFNAPSDVEPMPEKRKLLRQEAIQVCHDILETAERERIEAAGGEDFPVDIIATI